MLSCAHTSRRKSGWHRPSEPVLAATPLNVEGDPPSSATWIALAAHYDADVLAAFRATGIGWRMRMTAALRQYLREHHL